MQVGFGAGTLWGTQLTDINGAAIANPTPTKFGALQDVSVDFGADIKKLHGSNAFPLLAVRGKQSITCKAKAAQMNGALINSIFFGLVPTAGILDTVIDVTGVTVATTVTPTVPGGGTWTQDLGVRNSVSVPLTRVASGPITGQYSVAAGVYTFAAADVGQTVYIDFEYTATSTSAKKIAIINPLMGAAPTFRADLSIKLNGKSLTMILLNCVSTKLNFATKLDDFLIPEFDFEAYADASGANVGSIAFSE